MPDITLVSRGFPTGSVPNGTATQHWPWPELVWAAATVGKADWTGVTQHGVFAFFEVLARVATVFATLVEEPDGRIRRSRVYNGMDPSEKAATSYFLGLAVAKQLGHTRLGVPWLMHLDVHRHRVNATLTGRSRPDLVGTDVAGDWFVVESKGRSGPFDPHALASAKNQAQQVTSIGGRTPAMHIGVQAHFSDGVLSAHWEDPKPPTGGESIQVNLSEEDLDRMYYRPFRRLLAENPAAVQRLEYRGQPFDAIPIVPADLSIGLAPELRAVPPGDERGRAWVRTTSIQERTTVGADGIIVRLGEAWSTDNMLLEPQERSRTRQ